MELRLEVFEFQRGWENVGVTGHDEFALLLLVTGEET